MLGFAGGKFRFWVLLGLVFFSVWGLSARADNGIDIPLDSPQTSSSQASGTPPAQRGFFTRLGHAYIDDWTVDSSGAPPSPAPERRGTAAPLNSPPLPTPQW